MNRARFRDMSATECDVIKALLHREVVGREELMKQLEGAKVTTLDEPGSLQFQIDPEAPRSCDTVYPWRASTRMLMAWP